MYVRAHVKLRTVEIHPYSSWLVELVGFGVLDYLISRVFLS